MKQCGAQQTEMMGLHDKRQITAVLTWTLDSSLLPPQLIYTSKTVKCQPTFTFPDDWHIHHTVNHWSNTYSMGD